MLDELQADVVVRVETHTSTKTQQGEWIGRSEGAEIEFPILGADGEPTRRQDLEAHSAKLADAWEAKEAAGEARRNLIPSHKTDEILAEVDAKVLQPRLEEMRQHVLDTMRAWTGSCCNCPSLRGWVI